MDNKKIIALETAVASNRINDIIIDGHSDPLTWSSFVVRAFMGRSDLAMSINAGGQDTFWKNLENLRSQLAQGDLLSANQLINTLKPNNEFETCELALEIARLHLFEGKFQKVISETEHIKQSPTLQATSRLTINQIRSDALLYLNKPQDAVNEIREVLGLADLMPFASSSCSLRTMLIQAYIQLNKIEMAHKELISLEAWLNSLPKNEAWLDRTLTMMRVKVSYLRAIGDRVELSFLLEECQALSEWLQRNLTLNKTLEDKRDLNEHPSTPSPIFKRSNCIYLPRLNTLLHLLPRKMEYCPEESMAHKLLMALSAGSIDRELLFQNVWGYKYNKTTCDQALRMALSNLRKFLPQNSLIVSNGRVNWL